METTNKKQTEIAVQTESTRKIPDYSTLTMTNNFMFCKVMSDASLCKDFLEIMLKIKIDHIEYINSEQEMGAVAGGKAVRLDVYVDDGKRVFDIEMQMVDTKELPKRARYYQSLIDIDQIDSGMFYMQLKESFVIFLMPEDIFSGGLSCYTFENICRENPSIKLDDKTVKLFYNFNEYAKERDEGIRNILGYFATGKNSGGITDRMQDFVNKARGNARWRSDYIRYEHDRRLAEYETEQARLKGMERGIEEGIQKGIQKGIQQGIQKGIEQGSRNKAEETARNFLRMGLTIEQISQGTGLSIEDVAKIQVELSA